MKKLLIFTGLFILVLAFASVSAVHAQEDTIVYSYNTDATSLDPHVQNDTTSEEVVAHLYNTLLKFDEDGNIVGDLAVDWFVSEDEKTWTFEIRQDVKFHDGTPLTAHAFKATYDRLMDPSKGLVATEIIKMFEEVEVLDEYIFTITTDEPYGAMEALLCNRSLAVLNPKYIDEYGEDLGYIEASINGTGPYKMKSWLRDEEMVLERFDDYFGENAPTENIVYRPIPEDSSRMVALETGEIDVTKGIPSTDLNRLEENPDIDIIRQQTVGQRLFRFGLNDPIIADTRVRQAITYAIDRESIINSMFEGLAYPSTAPLSPVTWGYHNLGEIEQDLEKSMQLLEEAGYPDGFETKIVTTARYPRGVELAEVISHQLSQIGIDAEIEVIEWSALVPLWSGVTPEEFDQPIFIMGAGPSMMDADGGLRGLYTTTETGTNERNYGFYSNETVDVLVHEAMKETNPIVRKALYKRAQEILYREDPVGFWLYDHYSIVAKSSDVENVSVNPIGMVTFEEAIKK